MCAYRICLSGVPTTPSEVRSKRQGYIQENIAVAMNFKVENDILQLRLSVPMKVRDIIQAPSL